MRIALFITCFNDTMFPETGRAVVTVLERLGHTVEFPQEQTCCGQMHFNTGYRPDAVPLVARFARTFGDYDAVVTPSASCAGMVRENHPRLAEEYSPPALVRQVAELVPRVHEFTEFLTDVLGVTDVGASFPHKVAYHPTCHSLRGLRLGDRPERLLRAVKDLELVDIPSADSCCGFGGTFAVKNADTSAAMLADKNAAVLDSGAEVLCAADNSCLMHIGGGLSRQGATVRTMHLAEILAATEGAV
ncbi:L-lactate dehydrogenase complex protein LldE [Kitasatospora gansuensis]|uniref:L-lactate dehydrogenase complex protein LldE n=2 Tax=Kitasatospora TaxID=2063 RepID=A0A7W7WL10_9ACTN|nr:(Fe-S)-binding protein [Kitasatospora gansuensis]MBB4950986.1 L-lactate dehydrogenase complex protein LldE [Kitasatospora gansuensis]